MVNMFSQMVDKLESLPEYVRRIRRDKGLSLLDVEKRSRGEITDSQVNKIENGAVDSPGIKILQALARGLGRPEDEVFAVARGIRPKTTAVDELAALLKHFSQLPQDQQAIYRPMLDMLSREVEQYLADHPERRIITDPTTGQQFVKVPAKEVSLTPRQRKKTG